MTDPSQPLPDDVPGMHGNGASAVAADAPRLPEAVPAPTPTPPPTPEPHVASTLDTAEPEAPEQRRAPVGFFVLMLLIVGAIAAIGAVARPWQSTDEPPSVTVDETTAPSTVPATTAPTTPATTEATGGPTTTLVVAPLPPPPTADAADAGTDPFDAGVEACRTERRTLEVALEAHLARTGTPPSDPDELAAGGLIQPDPDGWSSRWAFAVTDAGTELVPVAGGRCDR